MQVTTIVSKALCIFSVIALLVMLFVTMTDVIMRFFFNSPMIGSIEIARMMLVCMSPAFVYALLRGQHVRVPVFIDMLGPIGQKFFDIVGYLASAALCGLMFLQGIDLTFARIAQRHVYSMLRIPTWPFHLLFAISMGLFALVILICLVDILLDKNRYIKKPKAEPVPEPKPEIEGGNVTQ